MTDLNWYDRLRLFSKDDASIKEWRDDIVNKNMNSSFSFLIKVIVIIETLHSTTAHHSVHFPHLIVLQINISRHWTTCMEAFDSIKTDMSSSFDTPPYNW